VSESACAWRLSAVLRELEFPAPKWMIQTTADLYGADVQTRIELNDLPESIYNDIDEVVSAVENHLDRCTGNPDSPEKPCCEWQG
jgi:hypothetical protein